MTSHIIVKNSLYNLIGWMLPIVVNFLTIPYIVKSLGNDSYGVLMLVTAVIGYFSLLDINFTAGSIRYVAEYHAKGEHKHVNEVLSLSFLGYSIIGIIGAILLYLSTDLFLMDLLKIPENLREVARTVFHISSFGFFLNLIQNYLSSIPKAMHRFDLTAKMEAGFGISLMLLTVVFLSMGIGLLGIVILRLVVALLNCSALFLLIKKTIPYSSFLSPVGRDIRNKMVSFSSYSFLSKVANTIYGNTDGLVIGSVVGSAAVTLYSVPFLLVGRLTGITSHLAMVLYPVASELGALGKRDELKKIYIAMSRQIFFLNIALTTILCLFSEQILQIWMGNEFARKTYIVLIFIALGNFTESLTNLPALVNDGLSFPQVTASFAFLSAFLRLVAVVIGVKYYGLLGVAVSYFISVSIVSLAFLVYAHKNTIKLSLWKLIKEAFLKSSIFAVVVVLGLLLVKLFIPSSTITTPIEFIAILAMFSFFAYKSILSLEWKGKINKQLGLFK